MKLSNSTTESPLSLHFRRFVALITLPALRLWGAAGTQYIPLKNMKSATGFFSDSDFLFSLCFIHIFFRNPVAVHIFLRNMLCAGRKPGFTGREAGCGTYLKEYVICHVFSASVNTFIIPIILENCN